MYLCWDITIPNGTPIEEPYEAWLTLPHGIVTGVDIKFPAGCHGMVGIRLLEESLQLVPLTEDEWITGDDEAVPTLTYFEMFDQPYKIKLQAVSPNCTYDHTITIRIQVALEQNVGSSFIAKLLQTFFQKLGVNINA